MNGGICLEGITASIIRIMPRCTGMQMCKTEVTALKEHGPRETRIEKSGFGERKIKEED